MRILVDLQVCQSDFVDERIRRDVLTLARALVDAAAPGEVEVLLADRAPHRIATLRRAFADVDARGGIVLVCEVHREARRGGARLPDGAARVLRDWVVAGRGVDLVIVPTGFVDRGEVVHAPSGGPPAATTMAALWLGGVDHARRDHRRGSRVGEQATGVADVVLAMPGSDGSTLAALGVAAERIERLPADATVAAAHVLAWHRRIARVGARDEPPADRRRLAFVSPLPPARTGVATYNARLLPALAAHYAIELVTDQPTVDLPAGCDAMPVRSTGWFIDHFDEYDRVLYHMGNSTFHVDVPALLRDCPGTVAMHDVYLGDLVNWVDAQPAMQGELNRRLVEGHGHGAARMLRRRVARGELARRFACNDDVLDEANGVIVHSAYAATLAAERADAGGTASIAVAGLCRGVETAVDRRSARRRLGIDDHAFVVASFGFVNHVKLLRELVLAWTSSALATRREGRLLLVGGGHGDRYHRELEALIESSPVASRIVLTGYVDDAAMADHFAAADIAVQLRSESRGETSGAALDCLAYGLPLITNGWGALGEIPLDAAIRLPANFEVRDLAAAMERLEGDPAERERLSRGATAYLAKHHAPAEVANVYARALERFASEGPRARYARLVESLVEAGTQAGDDGGSLAVIASAAAANLPRPGPAQLFVDITPLVAIDLRTGIERVARAVLSRLVDAPPPGFRVEAVRCTEGRFVLARRFMARWLDLPEGDDDREVEPRAGDLFLGLTWSPHATPLAHATLRTYRDRGVGIAFVVYDLLPQQHPEWFPFGLQQQHLGWLVAASAFADRLICISADVADNLRDWLGEFGPHRADPVAIAHFPLGCDIETTVSTRGIPEGAAAIVEQVKSRRTFLMVGTVEPRKGHRQALEAFDALWRAGTDVALAIVGKRGWMTEDVEASIAAHPELGRRLLRIADASDELLDELYRHCAALLAASQGEGFGLPIVEAARHGIPVIARDLPVFRELARDGAYYFAGTAPGDLAAAIGGWMALSDAGAAPDPAGIWCTDWATSTDRLVAALLGKSDRAAVQASHPIGDALAIEPLRCTIDFSRDTWPREIAAASGLSVAEGWGRWSDANVGPTIQLAFTRPLPVRATLSVTARAFGPNCAHETKIRIGDACYVRQFGASDSTVEFDIATDGSRFDIEIIPPVPVSPLEAGLSGDGRRLGVGLVRLWIR
jgi:glycosyltransferase involved in cell wall biosynthesis